MRIPRLDRWFWIILLLAGAVVVWRSVSITAAHSPSTDDEYHLRRGLFYLTDIPEGLRIPIVDGPVAEAIDALPMVLSGSTMDEAVDPNHLQDRGEHSARVVQTASQRFAMEGRTHVLFGHALSPDALLMRIAIFKSILFIPFLAIVFQWVRSLYGLGAGTAAVAMLVIDPSFAANVPMAGIDMLAAEMVIAAQFFLWRWVEKPRRWKMALAVIFTAAAFLSKQTAIIMPVIALGYMALWWWRRVKGREWINRAALFLVLFLICAWGLTKFDFSRPSDWIDQVPGGNGWTTRAYQAALPVLQQRWPGGQYIASVVNSLVLDQFGRWAYLFGHAKVGGWWWYYFALLELKAPLGFLAIFLLGIVSLIWRKPFFAEWSILLPAIVWGAILMESRVNIGIRHFLPEYAMIIMLASRCVGAGVGWIRNGIGGLVVFALVASEINAATYHPDYLSYINWPYDKPWLLMNDSNIDWGQGLKEVGWWLDAHEARDAVNAPSPGTPACGEQSRTGEGRGGGSSRGAPLAESATSTSRLLTSAFSVQNSAFGSIPHPSPPRFGFAHRRPEYQGREINVRDRPVYLRYDWDWACVPYYLDGRVKRLTQFDAPPKHGILIICPLWVAGYLDWSDAYAFLRPREPDAIIGHCMLVYDMDRINSEHNAR